jgi:hypothetical protein
MSSWQEMAEADDEATKTLAPRAMEVWDHPAYIQCRRDRSTQAQVIGDQAERISDLERREALHRQEYVVIKRDRWERVRRAADACFVVYIPENDQARGEAEAAWCALDPDDLTAAGFPWPPTTDGAGALPELGRTEGER